MSETQENVVSESQCFEETVSKEETSTTETTEAMDDCTPTSTTNGVEKLAQTEDVTNQDIMDGFEFENKITESTVESTGTGSTKGNSRLKDKGFEETKEQKTELKSPLALWMVQRKINPVAIQLIYWNEWQKSAGIFGGLLFLLFSLNTYSLVTVITAFAMSLLAVAFLFRIGMTVVNAVQKTSAEHPFKHLLDEKIELSEESVQQWSESVRKHINCDVKALQKLFLVEDVVESLKFGVLLWLVSYIGSWFSIFTVTILILIALFTIPKLYEEKQTQIDQGIDVTKNKIVEVWARVEQKLPEKVKSFFVKEKKE